MGLELKFAGGAPVLSDGSVIEGYASLFGVTDQGGDAVLPGAFADQVAWVWRYTPTPYGPLALQLSHWLVLLAGLNPYYSAVLMRLPALVGVGLIGHLLPRVGRMMGVARHLPRAAIRTISRRLSSSRH